MAKMTIGPVTYEGTPQELREIIATFEAVDSKLAEVKPQYKTEKRHARVGERILITVGGAVTSLGQTYVVGDILEVVSVKSGGRAEVNGQGSYVYPDEYEVIVEPSQAQPEYKTVKRNAKAGERILITDATMAGGTYKDGDVRTVIESVESGVSVADHPVGIFHREYEVIVEPTQAKPPADLITHNGANYSLVQRKAQAGDVVVFTENTTHYFTVGRAYGPVTETMKAEDNEGDFLSVYRPFHNRTEANVLVYEKVAKAKPNFNVGDIVMTRDSGTGHSGVIGEVVGFGATRPLVRARTTHGRELDLYSDSTIICPAESRVDTK